MALLIELRRGKLGKLIPNFQFKKIKIQGMHFSLSDFQEHTLC